MTPQQREALQAVLASLSQFTYGPIEPGTPYQGAVSLTAEQYKALEQLAAE